MFEYEFICEDCKLISSATYSLEEIRKNTCPKCPECGKDMNRLYSFNVGNKSYSQSIHSDALAINPNQTEEHRRLFPDVEIDSEGRPIFTNFKQHDSYLKKTGFVKLPQKLKKHGKRIA